MFKVFIITSYELFSVQSERQFCFFAVKAICGVCVQCWQCKSYLTMQIVIKLSFLSKLMFLLQVLHYTNTNLSNSLEVW